MPEITFEQLKDLLGSAQVILSALITGIFTIVGVLLGNHMSRSAEQKRLKSEQLIGAYSEFMSILSLAMHYDQIDGETAEQLMVATMKMYLFCPNRVAERAGDLAIQLIRGIEDRDEFSDQFDRFIRMVRKLV